MTAADQGRSRRIAHVVVSLGVGGAERMLVALASESRRRGLDPLVVTLRESGALAADLERAGVEVHSLDTRHKLAALTLPFRLTKLLRRHEPDVIQTWMYHADFVGAIAGLLLRKPVVWGIQAGTSVGAKRSTAVLRRISARFASRLASEIVCCAESSRRVHLELGFPETMVVVPNACNTAEFHPDEARRREVREALGADEAPLVGMVARADPLKDHKSLISAITLVRRSIPDVRLVLAGGGIDPDNGDLTAALRAAGIDDCTHLLGAQRDVAALDASLDVFVLASRSEGLPLVLVEAMACGVPAVASDVGDCARVIGDTGRVVEVGSPDALANAVRDLLLLDRSSRVDLGMRARDRIEAHFSLDAAFDGYSQVWHRAADFRRGRRIGRTRGAR